MAYLLRKHANEKVDIARVMLMCLIYDIVEIDAGDTYAYNTAALQTQKAREDAAKQRNFLHCNLGAQTVLIWLKAFQIFKNGDGVPWMTAG